MKNNNKGFSLVELLVVISIMVVMTGLITAGIGLSTSKPADECAKKIESTLQEMRVACMGKYDAYLQIYKSNGQIYAKQILTMDDSGTTSEKLYVVGAKGVDVAYEMNNNGAYTTLAEGGAPIVIRYDRSSGAFGFPVGSTSRVSAIKCSKGTKTAEVKMTLSTGKIKVN